MCVYIYIYTHVSKDCGCTREPKMLVSSFRREYLVIIVMTVIVVTIVILVVIVILVIVRLVIIVIGLKMLVSSFRKCSTWGTTTVFHPLYQLLSSHLLCWKALWQQVEPIKVSSKSPHMEDQESQGLPLVWAVITPVRVCQGPNTECLDS